MINDVLKALNGLGEVIQSLEKIKKDLLEEVAKKGREAAKKEVLATWINDRNRAHEIKIEKVAEGIGVEKKSFYYLYSDDNLLNHTSISFIEAKDLAVEKGYAAYADNWSCSIP